MDKFKIKIHLHDFLTEAEKKAKGLASTEKVQRKEKSVNNDYYKEVSKKMGEYDSASKGEKKSVKKKDLEKIDSEEMDVNPNGLDQIQYDNDPNAKFKQRAIDALEGTAKMGNETKEGKWNPKTGEGNGNTEEVWGASGGKHTGKEIVKAAKRIAKKDARPQEDAVGYVPSKPKTKLATENKKNNNEIIIENKMENKIKRATFKKPFNGIGKALAIIPEGYKVDNNVFEMTDGNEKYRIRWEGSLTEGEAVVLMASDKNMMNEDIQHMKHLMGYKGEDTIGTPTANDRINEESSFRDIMNLTSKILTEGAEHGDRKPITETAFAGMGFTSESNLEEVETVTEEEVSEGEVDESNLAPEIKAQAAAARKAKANESVEDVTETENVSEETIDESTGITPNEARDGKSTKVGDSTQANGRKPSDSGHDTHVMETENVSEDNEGINELENVDETEDVTETENLEEGFDFDAPTIYTIAETTQQMAAGDDLGTKIGKSAKGDPRPEGHDKHVMETDDVKEGEEIAETTDQDDDDEIGGTGGYEGIPEL